MLKFRVEQEKAFALEWQNSSETEKQRVHQLRDQLHSERSKNMDQIAKVSQLQCQVELLQSQLQKTQENYNDLR